MCGNAISGLVWLENELPTQFANALFPFIESIETISLECFDYLRLHSAPGRGPLGMGLLFRSKSKPNQ